MTLIKKHYTDFPNFGNWLEDFFSKEMDFVWGKATMPSVNIKETNENFVIEVAAPGFVKEDFSIDLDTNILTISSSKKCEHQEKDNYTKREFCYSNFNRSFTLPDTVDKEKISAKYEAGILYVTIGKKDESIIKPTRKIEIG